MTGPSISADPDACVSIPIEELDEPRAFRDFRGLVSSIGLLAGARQIAGLLFVGVVLVLPEVGTPSAVDQFLWAYFAMLILTSAASFGLERTAGLLAAHSTRDLRAVVGPTLVLRMASIPLQAIAVWAIFAVVGVTVPLATALLCLVWIVASEIQLSAFGAFRTSGRQHIEPVLWLGARALEASALLGFAAMGASSAVLVGVVAGCECVVAVVTLCKLPGRWDVRGASNALRRLPWRTVQEYALVDLVGVAYLRADLVLVGAVLGPGLGATYGLVSRLLDGLIGLQSAGNAWLFAHAVRMSASGAPTRQSALRARAFEVFPLVAILLGLGGVACAGRIGALIPSLAPGVGTLRLLFVAFPLVAFGSMELVCRSGAGRNRLVLGVVLIGIAANVGMNLVLLPRLGLEGAGWAVLGSEVAQILALCFIPHDRERHAFAAQAMRFAVPVTLLLLVALALNAGTWPFAAVGAVGVAAAVLVVRRGRSFDGVEPGSSAGTAGGLDR